MKKNYLMFMAAILLPLLSLAQRPAQDVSPVRANYQLASQFSPEKLRKMIFSTGVSPNWLKKGDLFWYVYETSAGKKWYLVDPAQRKKEPLFDNADFAAQLTRIVKDPFDAQHIEIRGIRFSDDASSFRFEVQSTKDTVKSKEERERGARGGAGRGADSTTKKVFYLEYNLASKKIVELADSLKPKMPLAWANFSPDTNIVVYAKAYNLYWMSRADYEKLVKNEKDTTVV